MDNEVELGVVLMMCFGLIAEMFVEINEFIIIMSLCYLRLRRWSRYSRRLGQIRYGLRSKVTRQLDHLHFLVNYDDETCRDHIRMNSDCFNRLCFLLQNLGGPRATRNVTISEQVAIFLTVLSHHTKNRVVKYSFRRPGYTISKHFNSVLNTILKLHRVLLVTPELVPEDSNDYRLKYFKGCLGALDCTYIPVRVPDIPHYRNMKGHVSVNVLVLCDWNMNYIYVLSGWETILGTSGIGLNTATYRIEAVLEVWEARMKVEIFGNDRATGIDSQGPIDAEHNVINQTAKGLNSSTCVDQGDTVDHFADKTDSRFGQIADTMGNIAQRVGFQFDACKKRGEVYDHLGLMEFLTVGWRVKVAQYL
ncbi:hypothetical protein ACS0TY_029184 [Phlomoides rotata]